MRRRLLIGIIIAVILISLGVGAVLLVDRTPALQNALTPAGNSNTSVANVNTVPASNSAVNANPDKPAIEYVARNFSEQFGSGTTQNDFANVIEAKQWGTVNFNSYLDTLVTQGRAAGPAATFTRTISSALVFAISKQTATTATVTVSLQRVESGDHGDKQYTQDLVLDLVKQGASWKINAASWQPIIAAQ